jgi:hypothetical protein
MYKFPSGEQGCQDVGVIFADEGHDKLGAMLLSSRTIPVEMASRLEDWRSFLPIGLGHVFELVLFLLVQSDQFDNPWQ